MRRLPLPRADVQTRPGLSVYAGRRPEVFTARQDLEGLSFYQSITTNTCICNVCVCVCVCVGGGGDEMSVSLCLCKRSGLLRDGAP